MNIGGGNVADESDTEPESEVAAERVYVVVFRARSHARFLPEEGWQMGLNVPDLGIYRLGIRAYTRWEGKVGAQLPRELVVECRGPAESLDDATAKFSHIAHPLAVVIGFVANVQVGPIEVHLGYEATPSAVERPFLEVALPDQRGGATPGRIIQVPLLDAVFRAYAASEAESPRISRALIHYELGLRHWHLGGEWLALNHLWIAAENLTKAVVRSTSRARSISESELAREYGLVTDDPSRPRWKDLLGARVREGIIFQGDTQTYAMAKRASDGIEHGLWGLDEMSKLAVESTEKTCRYVRECILDLLGVEIGIADAVAAIAPRDVSSTRKAVRGRLVGMAEDPAPEGELYPHLQWSWDVQAVVRDGTSFRATETERFTVRTHRDVGFILDRFEVTGRLEPGEEAVQFSDDALTSDPPDANRAEKLVGEVMPLVDAALEGSDVKSRNQAELYAFELHGQAVAYFQAISVILGADQPVEALPLLGGLISLAGRFEQMTDPAGLGLGIAIRDAINAIEGVGADPDVTTAAIQRVLRRAEADGIAVPDALHDPSTTSVYASLAAEAKMAILAASGSYAAARLHSTRGDGERAEFHVAGHQGIIFDLVASASVIAMLEVLASASELLAFSPDMGRLHEVLGAARVANEVAAGFIQG